MQNLPGGVHETRYGKIEPRVDRVNFSQIITLNCVFVYKGINSRIVANVKMLMLIFNHSSPINQRALFPSFIPLFSFILRSSRLTTSLCSSWSDKSVASLPGLDAGTLPVNSNILSGCLTLPIPIYTSVWREALWYRYLSCPITATQLQSSTRKPWGHCVNVIWDDKIYSKQPKSQLK